LIVTTRFIRTGIDVLTVSAPFGEECLWPDWRLMSQWRAAFALSRLPKHCDPESKAEPKRNIALVRQNDFSSQFLQVSYWQTLRPVHCKVGAKNSS
jgi:hypothetical protein